MAAFSATSMPAAFLGRLVPDGFLLIVDGSLEVMNQAVPLLGVEAADRLPQLVDQAAKAAARFRID